MVIAEIVLEIILEIILRASKLAAKSLLFQFGEVEQAVLGREWI